MYCFLFLFLDANIAHISVCTTGAMAHADVCCGHKNCLLFFVVFQGLDGFVQHPHIQCQSGGRGLFDIEFVSLLFEMCFHIMVFDVQFLLTE